MYEWLCTLLPMLVGGKIPPNQDGVPGASGTPAGGTAAPDQNQDPSGAGVPAGESAGGAASPTLGEISDTTYYQLDPDDPKSRYLGTQVKEAFNRARQYDTAQSRLHQTENQNKELSVEVETLRSQVNEFTENARLQDRLTQMGIPVQQQGVQAGQQQAPAGQGYPGNAQVGDEWMLEPNVPNQQPTNTPTGIPDWLLDPNKFAQVMRSTIQQEVVGALTGNPQIREQFGEAVGASVGQTIGTVEEERYAREMTARTLAQDKEQQAQSLRDIGVGDVDIDRILAMQNQAAEKHREAEMLMGVTGRDREQSVAMAQIALKEAQTLTASYAEARANALIEWKTQQKRNEAMDVLETGDFGVDLSELPTGDPDEIRMYDPKEIDKARKSSREKAKELMAAQRRNKEAAGII